VLQLEPHHERDADQGEARHNGGDRVTLLTFRPGRVKREFPVDLPRPRHLEDVDVARAARQILDELREEINRSLEVEYHEGIKPHVEPGVEQQ